MRPTLSIRDRGTEALLAHFPYEPDNLGEVRRWAEGVKRDVTRFEVRKLNALVAAAQGRRFNGR